MKKFIYLLKVGVIFTMFSLLSVAKETLIIGTNAEFAPFEYLDNGKVVGFDIDLINEIGKKLDLNIKIENLSFDGLLPALQAKKVDLIIAGMTATEDRKKFVDFTDDYFIAKQVLIVEDVSSAPQNFEDLKGKKVGTILGYTGDLIISKIPEIKSEKYNAPFGAIMALKSGKIDAVILDSAPSKSYVNKNKGLKIVEIDGDEEKYAIAGRKDSKELIENINKALEEIQKDGTYEILIQKHFN